MVKRLALFVLVLALIGLILVPRVYIRDLRHTLARLVMWQWKRGSEFSSLIYYRLWNRGNGK